MWVNPETKQIFKTHSEIRSNFSHISMPVKLTEDVISFLGLESVRYENKPDVDHTMNVIENQPELIGEEWVISWSIENASPEEIEERFKAMVPFSITKRQCRQQMILMGVIDQVQTAINSIEDPVTRALTQSFWDDSTVYERYHPQMISLSEAIGFSEQDLDNAFIAASKL